MKTQPSEKALIQRAQSHDLEAFNQLVLMYQDALFRYAGSLVNDHDLAEDITQESFLKAFQNIQSLYGDSFRPWLFKIATNTVRDIARRRARHPEIQLYPNDENGEEVESPEWLIDPDQFVETAVQRNEAAACLYRVFDELPKVYRSILTLIDLQEMDYTEAAKILNVPLGTVKSRLARARMRMRRKLSGGDRNYTTSNRSHASTIDSIVKSPQTQPGC